MSTQSEQILENQLVEQLSTLGYSKVKITDEATLLSNLKAQLEKHNNIVTKGLNIYYGGGLQKGWVLTEDKPYKDPFGVVGIIGAEFNVARLNVSYDIKPAVNLVGGDSPVNLQTGISIRYIFDKRSIVIGDPKAKAKRQKKRRKQKDKRKRYKQRMKDKYGKKKDSNT